jgi:hypothetical protein
MVAATIETTVTGLQGNPISTLAPAVNQGLVWNGSAWAPGPVSGLNSPAFTGTPTAPTPPLSNNSTQVATTAFVRTGVTDGSNAAVGQIGELVGMSTPSPINLPASGTTALTSMTVQPGVWLCFGVIAAQGEWTTTTCGIGSTPTGLNFANAAYYYTFGANNFFTYAAVNFGPTVQNFSSPTVVYLSISLSAAGSAANVATGSASFYRIR